MGKVYFSKDAQYTLPAWSLKAYALDSITVDSNLWDSNIPIVDATYHITCQPDSRHDCFHSVWWAFTRYDRSTQQASLTHRMLSWSLAESGVQTFDEPTSGKPYGHGINIIGVTMQIDSLIPITRPIIYYVHYQLEVTI